MAEDNFDRALALTLRFEGGFVDHPADPGGATSMGITARTLADWRGRPVTARDVRALSASEAAAIYRRNYWEMVGANRLPAGVDAAVFDFAVNSGVDRASRALQRVLGVPVDGIVGRDTTSAAARADPAHIIADLSALRRGFLRRLGIFPVFGRGWLRRVAAVEAAALDMAGIRPGGGLALLSMPQEFSMYLTKTVLESRTVWANVIGFAALIASVFGYETSATDQAGLADALLKVVAGGSFIASTFYRVKATRQIG